MRCNLTQKEVAELSGIIENMRIEATYKGNYHLYAVIDGKERKFDRTRIM